MTLLEDSIEFLGKFQLPISGRNAALYLASLLNEHQMEGIFNYFFPKEYAAFKEQPVKETVDSEGISPIESTLFNLISDRLFPLYEIDFYGDLDDEGYVKYLQENLPLKTFGWCEWRGDGEIDSYSFEAQALMFLADDTLHVYSEEYKEIVNQSAKDFILAHTKIVGLDNVDLQELDLLCQQESTPIKHLVPALLHADGRSGNIFLDCYDSELIYDEERRWTIQNLKCWSQEWKEAEPVLQQIDSLTDYLSLSNTHFDRIFELWNLCTRT